MRKYEVGEVWRELVRVEDAGNKWKREWRRHGVPTDDAPDGHRRGRCRHPLDGRARRCRIRRGRRQNVPKAARLDDASLARLLQPVLHAHACAKTTSRHVLFAKNMKHDVHAATPSGLCSSEPSSLDSSSGEDGQAVCRPSRAAAADCSSPEERSSLTASLGEEEGSVLSPSPVAKGAGSAGVSTTSPMSAIFTSQARQQELDRADGLIRRKRGRFDVFHGRQEGGVINLHVLPKEATPS